MMGTNKGGFQWQNWNFTTGYKPMQWRSTVASPLCALCDKTVYPAEEVIAAGQKFHKLCLKCTACHTLLNTGNLNEHEKKIYCVPCYRRQHGPRGVGRGLGASSSFHAHTPLSSPNPYRIETHVDSDREQRKTSTGSSPSRTSSEDDSRHSTPQVNSVTYVGGMTTLQMNYRSSSTHLTTFKMLANSGNICPRCSKTVYLAEEIKAVGKSFHKRCYNCAHCKGSISGGRYSEHDGELYDNNCYQRLFGPKGISSTNN